MANSTSQAIQQHLNTIIDLMMRMMLRKEQAREQLVRTGGDPHIVAVFGFNVLAPDVGSKARRSEFCIGVLKKSDELSWS